MELYYFIMKAISITLAVLFLSNFNFVSAQSTSTATLKETLDWIKTKCILYSDKKEYPDNFYKYSLGKPIDIQISESECSMTFLYNTVSGVWRYTIYFSQLNGNSITWKNYKNTSYYEMKIIAREGATASFGRYPPGGNYVDKSGTPIRFPYLELEFNFTSENDLANRMSNAFKRAIQLCGGSFVNEKF